METLQEKYDDLVVAYRNRGYKIDELASENNKLRLKLDSADYKIKSELEPGIKREEKGYDMTLGMGDDCFRNGMSGKCGNDCPSFDTKSECINLTQGE